MSTPWTDEGQQLENIIDAAQSMRERVNTRMKHFFIMRDALRQIAQHQTGGTQSLAASCALGALDAIGDE